MTLATMEELKATFTNKEHEKLLLNRSPWINQLLLELYLCLLFFCNCQKFPEVNMDTFPIQRKPTTVFGDLLLSSSLSSYFLLATWIVMESIQFLFCKFTPVPIRNSYNNYGINLLITSKPTKQKRIVYLIKWLHI